MGVDDDGAADELAAGTDDDDDVAELVELAVSTDVDGGALVPGAKDEPCDDEDVPDEDDDVP